MESVNTAQLQEMLITASDAIIDSEPELTRIDRLTGDGDHGVGMKLGFGAVRILLRDKSDFEDPVALLAQVGIALIDVVGGASGVLFGTLFVSGARQLTRKADVTAEDFARFLTAGTDAIVLRGRAHPGDKTMLDALIPAAQALSAAAGSGASLEDCLRQAAAAAWAGVNATKSMQARAGRAKSYSAASIRHPDAGATTSAILLTALSEAAQALACQFESQTHRH